MNLIETEIIEKIKSYYTKNGKTFQDLSENSSGTKPKYCVKSIEKAISGDNLKLCCCPNNKSVDAISINNDFKICLIEFKTKKVQKAQEQTFFKDLLDKFADSKKCFFHNFDKNKAINSNFFENYCFIEISNKPKDYDAIQSIKRNMTEKQQKIFEIHTARFFEENINKFKMHNCFIND